MQTMAKRKPISRDDWPALLKALRKRYALTQAEAADEISVALDSWNSWELGRRIPRPSIEALLRLKFPDAF